MTRILFVEQNIDGTIGGSYICLLQLVKGLSKDRYSPFIVFHRHNEMEELFREQGCDIRILPLKERKIYSSNKPWLTMLFTIVQKVRNFAELIIIPFIKFTLLISEVDADIVHINNVDRNDTIWLLAAKLLRKRCVMHQRIFASYDWHERMCLRLYDRVICVSEAVKKHAAPKDACVIYDGLDPLEFRRRIRREGIAVRKELGLETTARIIGMVGNIQKWKGQKVFVEAINILRDEFPDIVCVLIGGVSESNLYDMEYFEVINEYIEKHNLEKYVVKTGFRSDVAELINMCEIMVHASTKPEPFGMVILEAMSLKKVIIATDIGGPKEIIEDGVSGYLIPPNVPTLLAEKIGRLLGDDNRRKKIENNAMVRIEEKFSVEKFNKDIDALYQAILG